MTTTESRPMSALVRIFLLLVAVLGVVFTARAALGSMLGQQLDQIAMENVHSSSTDPEFMVLSHLGDAAVLLTIVLAVGTMLVQLFRRDFAAIAAGVVLVIGANVTTQFLKYQILERPDLGLGSHNSLPSGHTTMAASFGAVALLGLSPKVRSWGVLVVTTLVSLMGLATVIAGWHRPSDVVAALFVTLAWTSLVTVPLGPVTRLPPLHVVPAVIASLTALILLTLVELSIPSLRAALILFVLGLAVGVFSSLVVRLSPNSSVGVARTSTLD